jgi:aldehyde:ferredoxin oxidoreductase
MGGGYMGKVLFVDLSNESIAIEEPNEKLYKDFLGGAGLGARILFDRQQAKVDPLGPENTIGFIPGVLTGTLVPYSGRYQVVAKSPLTQCWGDACAGGNFGPHLKYAGFDAVFVTGIAEKPVYLAINNGRAEICDATHLWGKDSFITEDILKEELGHKTEIACIGQGGEKLSLIAAVMNNKGRAAARSGIGAVMGSKKLKAIAVNGNMKVPVADADLLKKLRRQHIERGKNDPVTGKLFRMHHRWGNVGLVRSFFRYGALPTKNYGGNDQVDFPDVDESIGAAAVVAYQEKTEACWGCPCACGGRLKAGTGEYQWEAGASKPEFEGLSFGIKCQNRNLESVIKCCDLTNRAGLDHCSAGGTIAFAIECYENGIIGPEDTGGVELTWGNHSAIVRMTEMMCNREGFGDILADGVRVAARKIGKGADEFAMEVHGQEIDNSDPRPWPGWALGYAMDATPARHTVGSSYFAESAQPPYGLGLQQLPRHVYTGKGEANRIMNAFHNIQNCTGVCQFSAYHGIVDGLSFPDFFKAVTGWDVTMDDLILTGERITNMRMAFNLREGINPISDFKIPGRIIGHPPVKAGIQKGVEIDLNTMVRDYLTAMDWDQSTCEPSRERLTKLGLEDLIQE